MMTVLAFTVENNIDNAGNDDNNDSLNNGCQKENLKKS